MSTELENEVSLEEAAQYSRLVEAARQALAFIERTSTYLPTTFDQEGLSIHAALRQALEQQPAEEPVALQMDVIVVNLVRAGIDKHHARELAEHFIKHTRPQPAAPASMTEMVDAAMVEMRNIIPPLRRSECQRLIAAALAAAPEQKGN